ncbi:MAG TPA: glycogen synthase [Chthoniobacterales bacterium]
MKALFLTNEYPPNIYGGAGVHVDYLSRELAKLMPVEVRCFGSQDVAGKSLTVKGFGLDSSGFTCPSNLKSALGAIRRCTDFNTTDIDAQIVHCHTWYTHFGGILAKLNYGTPLVITIHSLEPLRPWKREQLGRGYDFSSWIEKTAIEMADAIIAVSEETKRDVLQLFNVDAAKIRIIYNGIEPAEYRKTDSTKALVKYGIDPSVPYVLFVGRIARQKGIVHLVNAIKYFDPGFQVVLCAGAPDTPEIAEEMKAAIESARSHRDGIFWLEKMVPKSEVFELYSNAAVFCCPSIYEPFGIINLEAMACETAVVASAVGGIKEVVVDGETGYLVPLDQMTESPYEPVDPDKFARDFAAPVNALMRDPAKREAFGKAGRKRAVEKFSWSAIAAQTKTLYEELVK